MEDQSDFYSTPIMARQHHSIRLILVEQQCFHARECRHYQAIDDDVDVDVVLKRCDLFVLRVRHNCGRAVAKE